jgi:hypothetical protein
LVLRVSPDAYVATIAHRVLIVLVTTMLVLAVLRALLPPAIAWLIAAWWAVLPIRFETLYEVHLFSLIPVLVAALLVARRPTRGRRAAALAVLAASTVAVRNEFSIIALIVGIAYLWHERRAARHDARLTPTAVGRTYGVAAASVALVVVGFYALSSVQGADLRREFRRKHTLNVCQMYAFNYQQRHPSWQHSPWTECQPLMAQQFGKPMPSFMEAVTSNPKAMAAYFAWNIHLVPYGTQLSLFNSASGRDNPDYAPADFPRRRALALSALVSAFVITGAVLAWRDRNRWWTAWLLHRRWPLLVLGASSLVACGVMLMQRPRPSYTFALTLSMMLVVGISATVIARRLAVIERLSALAPVCALALLVLVPPHYHSGPRPLRDAYEALRPFASALRAPHAVLATTGYSSEICNYVAQEEKATSCPSLLWASVQEAAARTGSFGEALNELKATVIYADDLMLRNPLAQTFFAFPGGDGWRVAASGQAGGRPWQVLLRG